MSRIKIKNFGPIKEALLSKNGWIDIKKVTILVGNQGSGKSTVAKLISVFLWIEKVLTRGDFKEEEFTAAKFRAKYCAYHRITNYFIKDKTELFYEGESFCFTYTTGGDFLIERVSGSMDVYQLPQIMYVPAERSFISMVKPNLIKDLPDVLLTFLEEYEHAKDSIKGVFNLPINHASLEYNKQNDIVFVKGEDYRIRLMESSSGFQSIVPLLLVSQYLSDSVRDQAGKFRKMSADEAKRFKKEVASIWANEDLTDSQRRIALSVLSSKFNKAAFINIVEEPEQNLFPTSQWEIMQSLLAFNNSLEANKLVITTHSSCLINGLLIAVKAGMLKEKAGSNSDMLKRINEIYLTDSSILPDDIGIYEFDEERGSISLLETCEGVSPDDNFLNSLLEKTNDIFANLLEIQRIL